MGFINVAEIPQDKIKINIESLNPEENITSDFFTPSNFIGEITKIENLILIDACVERESTSGLGFPTWATLFTLPKEISPKKVIKVPGTGRNTASGLKIAAMITINLDGTVGVELNSDATYNQVMFTANYTI